MSGNLPLKWLDKAADDLAVARLVQEEAYYAHVCFLSQQCIEKALKGYILAHTQSYPRIHKLTDLLYECVKIDPGFSQFQANCIAIDQYYIPTRYPDSVPGGKPDGLPGHAEANEAILSAADILEFVKNRLSP
ncbi:MAG TPA: HEPN domain-containing protein [Chloroflexota bacterium]|nr:HEPN domain-containing protein [Chloroflexota bacterium]